MSREESIAFEGAGWRFIRVDAIPPPARLGRVYRHEDGHVSICFGRLAVQFQPGLDIQSVERAAAIVGNLELKPCDDQAFDPDIFDVYSRDDEDPLAKVEELRALDDVLHAEPDMLEYLPPRAQDPWYGRQWQWKNTGKQVPHSTAGADVSAEAAWVYAKGRGIKIAVIDTGFDLTHPDLTDAIYRTNDNQPRGGYFEYRDNSPQPPTVSFHTYAALEDFPPNPHGTACAGMALARINNQVGGCGMAPEAKFVPIAPVASQIDSQRTLAMAIKYAVDSGQETGDTLDPFGADVISCSVGPNRSSWEEKVYLKDAIEFAVNNGRNKLGTPIFWSVSNTFTPIAADEVVSDANVIAVGKSDANDLVRECAYGAELEFLAPGVEVFTTVPGGDPQFGAYLSVTGTSFAAPIAAGIAALMLQRNSNLTWLEVRDRMRQTCDKVHSGPIRYVGTPSRNDFYGYGRLNAEAAVKLAALQTIGGNWQPGPARLSSHDVV